jgi:hypothetical protein
MTRTQKIIGWFLYWLRERINERRYRLLRKSERSWKWIVRLDDHPYVAYWRKRDRGI